MKIKNNIIKKPKNQKKSLIWLAVIGLIFCEVMVHTWVRNEHTHTLLQVSRAQTMLDEMRSHNSALEIEKNRLQSEDWIMEYAKNRLGMIDETLVKTIYLPKDAR